MANSTRSPSLAAPARPYMAQASLTGGNGSPPSETEAQRLARMESLVERMRHELDVQLQRMAEMQVAIDRLTTRDR